MADKTLYEERFDTLLTALPAGVVVLDGAGIVARANPAAMAMLGESLPGASWRKLAARLFAGPAGDDLKLANGRLVSMTTAPLEQAPGQVILLHDVTEERMLRRRLEHARRLSDMGRMAASLAHQIRTPLSAALLYGSQLAAGGLTEPKQKRFAGKVVERLRHLEKLINDMLLFARSGNIDGEPFSAADLFEQAAEQAREQAAALGIGFEARGSAAHTQLRGNRTLLQSAVQNLVNNAIQAVEGIDGGRVLLTINRSDGSVELAVSDNGDGIAPEQLDRIFEPFHTGRDGGNGLGLAVVRAVAHSHGGEVTVESAPGKGSRFVIRIPCTDRPAVARAANE